MVFGSTGTFAQTLSAGKPYSSLISVNLSYALLHKDEDYHYCICRLIFLKVYKVIFKNFSISPDLAVTEVSLNL